MQSTLNPKAAAFPASGSRDDLATWAQRFAHPSSDNALANSRSSSQSALSLTSPAASLPDDPFGMTNAVLAMRLELQLSRNSLDDQSKGSSESTRSSRRRNARHEAAAAAANTAHLTSTAHLSIAAPSGAKSVPPGFDDPSLAPILEAARSGFLTPLLASSNTPFNPHATDSRGYPAMYLVAGMEHGPRTLDLLLQHGAQIEATDPNGNTALMLAIKNNQTKAAVNLLLRGANPDNTDADGDSALGLAEHNGNPRLADCLLRFGASPLATTSHIRSSLIDALHNRKIDDVFRLACTLEGKQELNPDGSTAMHLAAEEGDMEMLPVLLAAGFRPNTVDRMGNTPMHTAAAAGMESAVQFLLSRGGYATTRNNEGLTPQDLFVARTQSNQPIVVRYNPGQKFAADNQPS